METSRPRTGDRSLGDCAFAEQQLFRQLRKTAELAQLAGQYQYSL